MSNYLKGLDTLRALAALIVVWSHVEMIKGMYGVQNFGLSIMPNAHFSVTLFFVLSGFLITFLLVKEKEKKQKISFRNFYLRRILRIWPLYYLVIFLSYFLVSSDVSFRTVMLSLTIFPNVPLALKSHWPGSPQIWSIGVEEQFYLFWPLIIAFISKQRVLEFIFVFIVVFTIAPYVINYFNIQTIDNAKLHSFVEKFFYYTKFNCMAIGGFFGYSMAKQKKWQQVFYKNTLLAFLFFITPFLLWFSHVSFYRFSDEIYSLYFAIMILVVIKNPLLKIESRASRFLGKISYGLYMYHWIVTVLSIKLILPLRNENYFDCIFYPLSFGLTILVSWISYISFENYFLKLNKKFEVK